MKKTPPTIRLFGGSGFGASVIPVLGDFVTKDGVLTSSIIGGEIVSTGKNYKYPPFVLVEEESDQGYGAILRTTIDNKGKVNGIYVVSPGESYPVGNANINAGEDITKSDPPNAPYYVDDGFVLTTGTNYKPGDYGIDNFENIYSLKLDEDGSIIDVSVSGGTDSDTFRDPPIQGEGGGGDERGLPQNISVSTIDSPSNIINRYTSVTSVPIINIVTETGSGAILKPILKRIPTQLLEGNPENLRPTKFVKDCIGQDNQLVGYVNGSPYYGPFHVHPRTGVKMVGTFHTDTPHDIIYPTREASLGQPRTPVTSTSSTSTVVATPTPTSSTTPTPTPVPTPIPTPTPTPTPAPTPTPTPSPNPSPSPGYGGY
jgi:hypothetical protein